MKRLFFPGLTYLIPCTIVAGFVGGASLTADDWKPVPKARKKVAAVVRAQNVDKPNSETAAKDEDIFDGDSPSVTPGSKTGKNTAVIVKSQNSSRSNSRIEQVASDEEIFDRDLPATGNPTGSSASGAVPVAPNCIDVFGNPLLTPGTSPSTGAVPPVPPGQDSTQNLQSSAPPSFNQPDIGQGLASSSTTAIVAPFLGDFFGGSTVSSALGHVNIGDVVQDRYSPSLYSIGPIAGVPNHFQTLGSPFTQGPGDTLVPLGHSSVLFNPPANGSPPNPQNVQVFEVQRQLNTGGGGLDPSTVTGGAKLAEGGSPIPRDRVFFNYNLFNDVALSSPGIQVNRYMPGFEKTFFNGVGSVEVRVPFASTLSTNFDVNSGVANPTDLQFGNVVIYSKALLYQSKTFAASSGLGFSLPTANNVNIYNGQTQLLHIQNNSVHLLPFVGGVYTPNDRFYSQGLFQLDFDTNGNTVDSFTNSQGLPQQSSQKVGTFRDATFLFASVSTGYWIYRSQTPGTFGLTGFSPTAELHYNRSLNSGDIINQSIDNTMTAVYGQSFSNLEVLNGVLGANMIFGRNRILSMGYVAPLGMGVDKQFAGEFRLMFNWYFGGSGNSSPFTRVGGAQF